MVCYLCGSQSLTTISVKAVLVALTKALGNCYGFLPRITPNGNDEINKYIYFYLYI